jgi:hypothetical protein
MNLIEVYKLKKEMDIINKRILAETPNLTSKQLLLIADLLEVIENLVKPLIKETTE